MTMVVMMFRLVLLCGLGLTYDLDGKFAMLCFLFIFLACVTD